MSKASKSAALILWVLPVFLDVMGHFVVLHVFSEIGTAKPGVSLEVGERAGDVASVQRLEHIVEVPAQEVSIVMLPASPTVLLMFLGHPGLSAASPAAYRRATVPRPPGGLGNLFAAPPSCRSLSCGSA